MQELLSDPVPKGVAVTRSMDGHSQVRFHSASGAFSPIGWLLFMSFWTLLCVFMTYESLFGPLNLLLVIPFWCCWFLVTGWMLWEFGSVTTLTFCADRLLYERRFLAVRFRREIAVQDVRRVRKTKVGGIGSDFRPYWNLDIDGPQKSMLTLPQPVEKSDWLAQNIANWVGIECVISKKEET